MSRLGELAGGAEKATEDHTAAVDAATEAEAAYLLAYHSAFELTDESWSDAKRKSTAEQAAYHEKVEWKRAKGAVVRAQTVLNTRLKVLSAAQTQYKSIERQAG